MAFAATVDVNEVQIGGVPYVIVTITETGNTGTSNEKELTGLPELGEITYVKSTLTIDGGTATQIDPQLGEVTNSDAVWANTTAGTSMREAALAKRYVSSGRSLFWRSQCNGTVGAAGGVVSTIVIKAGHHP
jgi:hypothetical protein